MRRALIIGSEFGAEADEFFAADARLKFVPDLVEGLREALAAEWGVSTVLNPTSAEAEAEISAAVRLAAADQATLLLAFIGHGVTRQKKNLPPDFYLQYKGSQHRAKGRTSLKLVEFLTEEVGDTDGLNGLILLVDACATGGVPIQAALNLDTPLGGRLEVLVAADDGNAYSGCFTKTLTGALTTGIAGAGETIHPVNVYPKLEVLCSSQAPAHLSYTNGRLNVAREHDPALWLMPNRTRVWHALVGRPDAGFLDQITEGVALSRNQTIAIQQAKELIHARLRVVTGPAGTGKTTVLASLIKAQQDRFGQATASNISAAVFLSRITSPESIIVDIVDQLSPSTDAAEPHSRPPVPGAVFGRRFALARRAVEEEIKAGILAGTTDLLDRALVLPLVRSLDPAEDPVQIVIDGLDQVHPSQRASFIKLIDRLVTHAELRRLRVIVGTRSGDELLPGDLTSLGGSVVAINPPVWDDLPATERRAWFSQVIEDQQGQEVPGGWLTVRLLDQLDDDPTRYDLATSAEEFLKQTIARLNDDIAAGITRDICELLTVTGIGPVLPLVVLKQALIELGHETITPTQLGKILASLGPLIIRGRAGFLDEHLGYAHLEISRTFSPGLMTHSQSQLHTALANALTALHEAGWDQASRHYAEDAWPAHELAAGNAVEAVLALVAVARQSLPAVALARWAVHAPAIINQLGPDHPYALSTRHNLAYWNGLAGDVAGAAAAFGALLPARERAEGSEHPGTLATRSNLARWQGEAGDSAGAFAAFATLLPISERVRGVEHPATLVIRYHLAHWQGESCDLTGSLTVLRELLPISERVLGAEHVETLRTRAAMARRLGELGEPATAVALLEAVVSVAERVLGMEHTTTLANRVSLAGWQGHAGDPAGAVAALKELLPVIERVLGAGHPDTLTVRHSLARWLGQAGDAPGAVALLADLLPVSQRALGVAHPRTLTTRQGLAHWQGQAGDVDEAVATLREVLLTREQLLGVEHRATLVTRYTLACWLGRAGDAANAVVRLKELLPIAERVLGSEHPATLTTRYSLAYWLDQAGNTASANDILTELLPIQERVLGVEHPAALLTRQGLVHGEPAPLWGM